MKEFEQLKSDMISLMSHELCTPLTSIHGFSELLASDDKIPDESREFVHISADEAPRVIVEDRGYGVPADSIDRIWEKFYRVARDGQEKDEESTGLGLAFVKEVVEQHGGSVTIESEVGRGSKFSFALPRL